MKTYSEFRPTGCDVAGLALPDRQDWLVAPVGTNRDADILTQSNWEVVKADLENVANEGDLEEHEFGHWACGWFRILLVRPGSKPAEVAAEWENSLADYPVASDDDLSRREDEAMYEDWRTMRLKDRVELCSKRGVNIMAARHDDTIPEKVYDYMREVVR